MMIVVLIHSSCQVKLKTLCSGDLSDTLLCIANEPDKSRFDFSWWVEKQHSVATLFLSKNPQLMKFDKINSQISVLMIL